MAIQNIINTVVKISWDDYNNYKGIRPTSVTVPLTKLSDGSTYNLTVAESDSNYQGGASTSEYVSPVESDSWVNMVSEDTFNNDREYYTTDFSSLPYVSGYSVTGFSDYTEQEVIYSNGYLVYKCYEITYSLEGSIFTKDNKHHYVDRAGLERYTKRVVKESVIEGVIGGVPKMLIDGWPFPSYTVENDSTYYFTQDGNLFTSNNGGVNSSTARTSVIIQEAAPSVKIWYQVSSENYADRGRILHYRNGSQVGSTIEVSGVNGDIIDIEDIQVGDKLTFEYIKDGSVHSNDDNFQVELLTSKQEYEASIVGYIDQKVSDIDLRFSNMQSEIDSMYSSISTNEANIMSLQGDILNINNKFRRLHPEIYLTQEQAEARLIAALGGEDNIADGYRVWLQESLEGENSECPYIHYVGQITNTSTTYNEAWFYVPDDSTAMIYHDDMFWGYLKDTSLIDYSEIITYGSACFEESTLVNTVEGYREIKDIQVGDKVLSYNELTKEFGESEVLFVNKHEELKNPIQLVVGESLFSATTDHLIMDASGFYRDVINIKPGSFLKSKDSVVKVNLVKVGEFKVGYDLETTAHNYVITEENLIAKTEGATRIKYKEYLKNKAE